MPNLDFGKYALYVAPAYLISAGVIVGAVIDSLLRARYWKREAARREALKSKKTGS